ncbi:MAG: DUF1385 domain-containing protein [Chitinispirillales bacterium]|jgi:uncharacterized protein YqhQ|nr:DUF1385 domain-containing protein [Chitinispirillales bacterium]
MLRHLLAIFAAPAFAAAEKKDTVGGQALIEGVMMRGKEKVSWAVRRPDGETVVESFPFVSITKRNALCGIPVIRGVINLFESLSWGYKALSRSADIASVEVEAGDKASSNSSDTLPAGGNAASVATEESSGNISDNISASSNNADPTNPADDIKPTFVDRLLTTLSMLAAFAVSIALFMYAPMWTVSHVPFINDSPMLFNLSAGAIRITLFLIYILLISLWSEMRRVFEYHGAEHKTIFAYEDGKALTFENVEPYTTVHPRCGTSFLILVAICSILLFSVIDTLYIQYFGSFVNIFHRFVVHLILIPLVAGTSYEALKLSDRYQRLPLVGLLIKPGLWLQRITTRKPDRSQIEVAVKALEAAL